MSGFFIYYQDVDYEMFMESYVQNRLLLKPDAQIPEGNRHREYKDEGKLWWDVFIGQNIFESRFLFLKEFRILEWVPQSPGLYHTPRYPRSRDTWPEII